MNDKLQKLQNRTTKAITKSPNVSQSSERFGKLGWDDLSTRRKKHKAILMLKTVHDLTPYLHELFDFRSTGYYLRNLENTLFVPKPQTNYGERTFSNDGEMLWNELPQNVRVTCSFKQFKREIHNLFSM